MMQKTFFNILQKPRSKQQGAALMESLIGMLLMLFMFVATMQAMGITMKNEAQMNAKNIVLLQMHETLQNVGIDDICTAAAAGAPIADANTIGNQAIAISGTCNDGVTSTLSIDGVSVIISSDKNTMTLSTSSNAALFGGNGVISASY